MLFDIVKIKEAQERIAPYIIQTPLLRLENLDQYLGCRVFAKPECMQRTGSFKLRGAMNKLLAMDKDQLEQGVIAVSSGNHGRAVAYAAKMFGLRATVVIPDSAARVKVEAISELGAEIIQCPAAERYDLADRLCHERGSALIPPFDDYEIMAGQGTVGLELIEQCPRLDKVLVPVSGGGLLSGVAAAVKSVSPRTKVYGVAPEVLPHFSLSLQKGEPVAVPQQLSIADALASRQPGKKTFPVVQRYCDGVLNVPEKQIWQGMKLLLTEGKLLAEPSSCLGVCALLMGLLPVEKDENVCLVISGGNVGLEQLDVLKDIDIWN